MRPFIFVLLFVIAAVAIPIAIEAEGGKRLQRRQRDCFSDFVMAAIAYWAFIWAGDYIVKRAVDHYFTRKAQVERIH
jgi:hypothetical protein